MKWGCNMEKKNVAMSVRAKLLNIRNSEPGTEYMQVLLRYIQERMLYRLSMSQYRDNFCLKGSALLFAYEKFKARPTKDIDFLGDKISRDKETGVNYLFVHRGYGGGLTPLLDSDGKPIVTKDGYKK